MYQTKKNILCKIKKEKMGYQYRTLKSFQSVIFIFQNGHT